MPKLPDILSDPVEFLLRRRFPFYAEVMREFAFPDYRENPGATPDLEQKYAQIRAARAELEALPADELGALLLAEKEAAQQERQARENAEEQIRFFNLRSADARFDHWSRLPLWKLDEAVALTFGKDPSVVNPTALSAGPRSSSFIQRYFELQQIAKRAALARQLTDPCLPGVYIAWCRRNEIEFPAALEELLLRRGNQIGDWKGAFDALKASSVGELDALRQRLEEVQSELQVARQERDALQSAADAGKAKASATRKAAELEPREIESLLKLVIGMAIEGYRYNPGASRNTATKEIADDLEKQGIGLDVDTVRKWLQRASEYLPSKGIETE